MCFIFVSLMTCAFAPGPGVAQVPKTAAEFNDRGLAQLEKREYDKALEDFGEAIRLDPTCAKAFSIRGLVW